MNHCTINTLYLHSLKSDHSKLTEHQAKIINMQNPGVGCGLKTNRDTQFQLLHLNQEKIHHLDHMKRIISILHSDPDNNTLLRKFTKAIKKLQDALDHKKGNGLHQQEEPVTSLTLCPDQIQKITQYALSTGIVLYNHGLYMESLVAMNDALLMHKLFLGKTIQATKALNLTALIYKQTRNMDNYVEYTRQAVTLRLNLGTFECADMTEFHQQIYESLHFLQAPTKKQTQLEALVDLLLKIRRLIYQHCPDSDPDTTFSHSNLYSTAFTLNRTAGRLDLALKVLTDTVAQRLRPGQFPSLKKSISDDKAKYKHLFTAHLAGIAADFFKDYNLTLSAHYSKQALMIYNILLRNDTDDTRIANTYETLINVYLELHDFENAIKTFNDALENVSHLRVPTVAKRHMRSSMFTGSFILVSCVKLP